MGDIGDTDRERRRITLYRMAQPGLVYTPAGCLSSRRRNRRRKIAEIRFGDISPGARSRRDPDGALLATGGALSPDGRWVVIRTYTHAHEWLLGEGGLAKALPATPVSVPRPPDRGGEAITHSRDGRALLAPGEGFVAARPGRGVPQGTDPVARAHAGRLSGVGCSRWIYVERRRQAAAWWGWHCRRRARAREGSGAALPA